MARSEAGAAPGRPVVDAVRRFYRDDGITERPGATTIYEPVPGPVSNV